VRVGHVNARAPAFAHAVGTSAGERTEIAVRRPLA
jgi:hypothetical protein